MTSLPVWLDFAACKAMDSDVFFPDYPHYPRSKWPRMVRAYWQARDDAAKAVCAECPVIDQCRKHAFTRPETIGTWGGLTDIERRIIQGRSVQRLPFMRQATA